MNVLPLERKRAVLSLLWEGYSIRSTSRLTGVQKSTIMRLLVDAGEHCQRLLDRELRNLPCRTIEADEIWTFVRVKQDHLIGIDSTNPQIGEQYLFVGLDRVSKLIAAHVVGKRDAETTTDFIEQLRVRIGRPRLQIFTDGFGEYLPALEGIFGRDAVIHYAQVIAPDKATRRLRIVRRLGKPDKALIGTSYVERCNGTIRQQVRRFTRKTLAFSEKQRNLQAACALFVAWYQPVAKVGDSGSTRSIEFRTLESHGDG